MKWYLIQTKPNAHLLALQHLKRQGFEVFIPFVKKTSKRRRKFVNCTVPLFPNYLFMGTPLIQIPWNSVNSTRGISKAVTLDGIYRNVDNKIIEGLKNRCDKSGVIYKFHDVAPGDQVKIENGPFTNFICNVDKIIDGKRAWTLIELMQQKTRCDFSLEDLSKVY